MYPTRVKYELQEYEQIISSVEDVCGKEAERCVVLGNCLNAEVERIKQTFISEIFGFDDERHLERYIQYHQLALIRLMDDSVRRSNCSDALARRLYQRCYHGLEVLLVFIEKHFAKYFDQHAKAPEAYLTMVRGHIRARIDVLHKGLLSRDADVDIVNTVLYVLVRIMDEQTSTKVTYQQLLYAKEMQRELSKLVLPDTGMDINDELRSLMCYLNYNSLESFTCHTRYIDLILTKADTRTEKIETLSLLLKQVNQSQVKPGICYNFYALGLKAQVTNYLLEELAHLQRINTLYPGPETVPGVFSTVKIQLQLSVAQVAYLIKLFIDAQIMVNKNLTELLRFTSGFLVSKRTESISYDSLRAKYYNVEQSTKEAVKANLLKMLSLIDKD